MAFSKQTIPFYLYLMNSYQQNRKYTMRYDIAKLNLKQTVNINRNIDRRRELNSFIYCIQSNINTNNDSVDEIEIEIFHSLSLF